MPTLPLYSPTDARADGAPAAPHASHRVIAPGGYEWWHFEAADADARLRVVATLYDGYPFHPGYLRAHARYLRRPTRVTPAVPSQYPCVAFAAYEDGQRVAGFVTQFSPGSFRASDGPPELRVGTALLRVGADGVILLDVPGAATLTFRPVVNAPAVAGRTILGPFAAEHRWVIGGTPYEVDGTVRVAIRGAPPRDVTFRGRGCHDQAFGTGPIGRGLRRLVRGRAVFADHVRTFLLAQPSDRGLPEQRHLTVTGGGAARRPTIRSVVEGPGESGGWSLGFPKGVELVGPPPGDGLRLTSGRVLDATPFSLRVAYDATDGCDLTGGHALCDIIYPQRLRAPLVGRVIERAIKRSDQAG